MPPRLVARYLAPFAGRDGVRHLLALARSVRAQDVHEIDPDAIEAPTLVVWGGRDRLLPPTLGSTFTAHIPDSRLVVLPGAAHIPMLEAPDELNAALRAFLEEGADERG
jgi:pimeloyl-ACP methyl ester carboxylesterase